MFLFFKDSLVMLYKTTILFQEVCMDNTVGVSLILKAHALVHLSCTILLYKTAGAQQIRVGVRMERSSGITIYMEF